MRFLILLLLSFGVYANGNNSNAHHHDRVDGGSAYSGSAVVNSITVSGADSQGTGGGSESNAQHITITEEDKVANSAPSVVVDYCAGGISIQGVRGGMAVGGTESSCRKQQIREVLINEMYRKGQQGDAERVQELSIEIDQLMDDMVDNEDLRDDTENSWIWFKAISPWVLLGVIL